MKVFHGTNIIIQQPQIINRFNTLDFGEGFYTTENEEQAKGFAVKVSERREPKLPPTVNVYEFSDWNKFLVLKFEEPNEEWLDFVVARRKGIALNEKYDIIVGPVANDDVFGTIILYEAGQLDKESAIKKFKVRQLYNQIVFCNETVLKDLFFVESYNVEVSDEK